MGIEKNRTIEFVLMVKKKSLWDRILRRLLKRKGDDYCYRVLNYSDSSGKTNYNTLCSGASVMLVEFLGIVEISNWVELVQHMIDEWEGKFPICIPIGWTEELKE